MSTAPSVQSLSSSVTQWISEHLKPIHDVHHIEGFSDVYLVTHGTPSQKCVLRVRSCEETERITCELRLLAYLRDHGVRVECGVPSPQEALTTIQADQPHLLVRYTFSEGQGRLNAHLRTDPHYRLMLSESEGFGFTLGSFHRVADEWVKSNSVSERRGFSLEHIQEKFPMAKQCLAPIVDEVLLGECEQKFWSCWHDLQALKLRDIPSEFGLCHRDCHMENTLFDKEGNATLIDWETCGFGFRTYDMGHYVLAFKHASKDDLNAFLRGYENGAQRKLHDAEALAMGKMAAMREMWGIACISLRSAKKPLDVQIKQKDYFEERLKYFLNV